MRIFDGVIVSIGANNTVSVSVERKVPHPLYGKLMRKNKKFLVDAAGFELTIGDKVQIVETKPISKSKYFKIAKVAGKKVSTKKSEESQDEKSQKVLAEEKPVKVVKKTTRARKGAK